MKMNNPPRTTLSEIEAFGREEVAEIAKEKLSNLEKRWVHFENVVKLKEPIYYKQVAETKEYSVTWLTAMVRLYEIGKKRDNFERWYKYWDRLCLREQETVSNGFSSEDVQKAREYPIEDLMDKDVKSGGSGKTKTACPFHEEDAPSFFVYDDNSYHCFGCQKHGNNAIDFLMEFGLSFQEAVDKLL